MTATCPNGHASATADYCDQCGAKIEGSDAGAAAGTLQAELDPALPAVPAAAEPCPHCGAPRGAEDRFCEGCGHSFATGTVLQAPGPPPLNTPHEWEALVTTDQPYFERMGAKGIDFPTHAWERRFALDRGELRIGRSSSSADSRPQIDIPGAGEDPAVSRLHASFIRQDDGSYAVVDQGSTNGTSINEDSAPITANVPVTLADGDRVHLGAWTTITLRRTRADGAAA